MPYVVDFANVSTVGLESSPVADALAGLRANEARYYRNKYDHVFTVGTAEEEQDAVDRVALTITVHPGQTAPTDTSSRRA